jgi:hypothetical protein
MKSRTDTATLTDDEIERRMNAAIKRALNTPHKPHAPLKKKAAKKKAKVRSNG